MAGASPPGGLGVRRWRRASGCIGVPSRRSENLRTVASSVASAYQGSVGAQGTAKTRRALISPPL